ncbi:MAG: hypothetical protein HYW50_01680 [Candidatus Diapherotrites archaeon]|nr:hypothetical protein [Candidatus Diapherotrites archaeon]
MSYKYLAIAAVSLAIIFGFYYFFSPPQSASSPEILITSQPEKGIVGEKIEFEIQAKSDSEIAKIISKTAFEQKETTCSQKQCSATFAHYFSRAGTHQIEFIAQNSAGKIGTKKILVKVFDYTKKCADGTVFEECSNTKPLYCKSGKLEEQCGKCGCTQGTECIAETCLPVALKLEIEKISDPQAKLIPAGKEFFITITLKNSKNKMVAKGAAYTLKV